MTIHRIHDGHLLRSRPGLLLRGAALHALAGLVALLPPTARAGGPASPAGGTPSTLGECLRHADAHNPGIAAARSAWRAARARVPQVDALPDPKLSYTYYARPVETRVGPQRHALGLSQALPWYGKLDLRGEVASEAAAEVRQRLEGKRLEVSRAVRETYAELYFVGRSIDITRENIRLIEDGERIARSRFRVATGRHLDVVKAQVELGKLENRLRALEDRRLPLAARFNALLGKPEGAAVPWPAELPQRELESTEESLRTEMAVANPELRGLAAGVRRAEHARELAEKDSFPDLTLGVSWVQTDEREGPPDAGKDPVMVGLSFTLPIGLGRIEAGVEEAIELRSSMDHARADRRLALESELAQALYDFRDAQRRMDLYDSGLLPVAREALAAAFTGYESGQAGFLDVLDAERVLLDFRLAGERARADRLRGLARIEALVGRLPTAVGGADGTGGRDLAPGRPDPTGADRGDPS